MLKSSEVLHHPWITVGISIYSRCWNPIKLTRSQGLVSGINYWHTKKTFQTMAWLPNWGFSLENHTFTSNRQSRKIWEQIATFTFSMLWDTSSAYKGHKKSLEKSRKGNIIFWPPKNLKLKPKMPHKAFCIFIFSNSLLFQPSIFLVLKAPCKGFVLMEKHWPLDKSFWKYRPSNILEMLFFTFKTDDISDFKT